MTFQPLKIWKKIKDFQGSARALGSVKTDVCWWMPVMCGTAGDVSGLRQACQALGTAALSVRLGLQWRTTIRQRQTDESCYADVYCTWPFFAWLTSLLIPFLFIIITAYTFLSCCFFFIGTWVLMNSWLTLPSILLRISVSLFSRVVPDFGSGKSGIRPFFRNPAKSGSGQISSQI